MRFNDFNASNTELSAKFNRLEAKYDEQNAKIDQLIRLIGSQQISPILPSIETSPPAPTPTPAPTPAPPAAPEAPPAPPPALESDLGWNPYKKILRAEDVGYFDPRF